MLTHLRRYRNALYVYLCNRYHKHNSFKVFEGLNNKYAESMVENGGLDCLLNCDFHFGQNILDRIVSRW